TPAETRGKGRARAVTGLGRASGLGRPRLRGRVATRTAALGLLLVVLLALGALSRGPPHARDGRHAGHPAAAHHLPHHLLALKEPDDQVVHLTDGDPGAVGDPGPAAPVEDLRVAAF